MKQLITCFLTLLLVYAAEAQNRETRSVDTFSKISFRVPGKLYLRQGSPQKVEIEGDSKVLEKTKISVEGSRLIVGREGKWSNWTFGDDEKVNVYVTVERIDAVGVAGSGDVIGETKIVSNALELGVSGSGNLTADVSVTGDLTADVSGSGDLAVGGTCRSLSSHVSGSGNVNAKLAVEGSANLGISGSGKIAANGTASHVKVSISGSGKVLASDLETKSCKVVISGSGDVEIAVKDEIDATIAGSGSVRYRGNPQKVNNVSAGSGRMQKM